MLKIQLNIAIDLDFIKETFIIFLYIINKIIGTSKKIFDQYKYF